MFKYRVTCDGIHLFDRKTGLNILFDESRPPAEFYTKFPSQISIAITNSCNLTCPFCYIQKGQKQIDHDLLCQWLLDIDREGSFGVGFGGGEPLLHDRITDLCKFVAKKTNLSLSFTTNAVAMSEKIALDLRDNVNFIRVSMDGIGRSYENIRGTSFVDLQNKIKMVKQISNFGINFVVNSETLGEIDNVAEFASKEGASEFLLLPEIPTTSRAGIDAFTQRALQKWVFTYKYPMKLSVSVEGSTGLPVCRPIHSKNALYDFAHIDVEGTLKTNSYDKTGIRIENGNLISAFKKLLAQERLNENLDRARD